MGKRLPIDQIQRVAKINNYTEEQVKKIIIAANPILWGKTYLRSPEDPTEPFIPRWYQEALVQSDTKLKVVRAGRRIGKSVSLLVEALWNIYTEPNFFVIIAAPRKDPIRRLWRDLHTMTGDSPELFKCIKSFRNDPHELELTNGSIIKAIAVNQNPEQIRGQGCGALYMDEADYFSEEALASTISLLMTAKETTCWASSTPTGARGWFYDICHDDLWHHFHYSSKVSPIWDDKMEKTMRASISSESAWIHEVCFTGDTLVRTILGNVPIKDIKTGDMVYAGNGEGWVPVLNHGLTRRNTDIMALATWGSTIKCTPDHGFRQIDGSKKKACDVDEMIYTPIYIYGDRDIDKAYARIVGYINGDGTVTKRNITHHVVNRRKYEYKTKQERYQCSIYSKYQDDLKLVLDDIHLIFGQTNTHVTEKPDPNHPDTMYYQIILGGKISKALVDKGAIVGRKKNVSFDVPDWIKCNSNLMKEYISALFGAEGSTPRIYEYYAPHTLSLCMVNDTGCRDKHLHTIYEFIASLDIQCSISEKKRNNGMYTTIYVGSKRDNLKKFFDCIGYRYCLCKELDAFRLSHYFNYIDNYINDRICMANSCRNAIDSKTYTWRELAKIWNFDNWKTLNKICSNVLSTDNPRPKGAMLYYEWYNKYCIGDNVVEPIINKELVEKENVYNITVNSIDHSYILSDGATTFNCAEFGDEQYGVFKHVLLDSAIDRGELKNGGYTDFKTGIKYYNYDDCPIIQNGLYLIGVDWNGAVNGCHAVVTEVYKQGIQPKLRVVNRKSIHTAHYTQTKAVQMIIELNQLYKPRFIYADEGYGTAQIEQLKLFGVRNTDSRMAEKVKGIAFHKEIEVEDPYDKTTSKKMLKNYMIDTCVRLLESDVMMLPKHEDEKGGLVWQMRNFVVERTGIGGRPIYKKGDDHIMFAYILSIYAWVQEFTNFISSKDYATSIYKLPSVYIRRAKHSGFESRRTDDFTIAGQKGELPQQFQRDRDSDLARFERKLGMQISDTPEGVKIFEGDYMKTIDHLGEHRTSKVIPNPRRKVRGKKLYNRRFW